MKKEKYSEEFKRKAIELAGEIGAKEAVEKLGLSNPQTIGSWKRYLLPNEEKEKKQDIASLLEEVKRLKKELAYEKRSVAMLREATAFFSKEVLK